MSSKPTRLVPSKSALPTITPHLMPFHVEHTGSVPLSTYFIVKPGLQPESPDSTDATSGPSLAQRAKGRFSAAFRGRKMQGLSVNLPDGYSGIVLKNETLGIAKSQDTMPPKRLASTKTKGKKNRRATRSSRRTSVDDIEEEDGGVIMEGETMDEDNGMIQTLHPTAKFSSFTLWNADVDVDEGRDEYLRALSEYQRLSTEIHRIDP